MRRFMIFVTAVLALVVAQASAVAQYGPPSSGSSAAILFTPATVKLVAGLNGQGSSGNGSLATAAKLYYPVGIAYDSSGNLFVADGQNYVIRRIDHVTQDISVFAGTSGTFGNSLGGGVATSAQLGILAGLVIDTSNNVYVSDRSNNVVWKITPGGAISVYAGGGSSGLGDGGPATSGKLNNPWALGIDASNNIYISDSYDDLVREVNYSTNVITTFAGVVADAAGGFGNCTAGSLYSTSTPPYLPTQAHLCFPQGVAFDSSGNAYIVDISNHIVRVVNHSTGYISTFAGGGTQPNTVNGIAATTASLSPSGVYVDPGDRVYIADSGGALVRVVDSSGNINTVFGNGFGDMTGSIGLPDTQAITNNVGPADGIDDMTMDIFGNLIASDSSGEAITSAGGVGQYVFPQTAIFTTKTTTQANATSSFYPPYLVITNPSGVTLNFTGTPAVTGPFAIVTGTGAGTCAFPGSLAPGQSCTVVMSFTPTLGGSPGTVQTGSIVLNSNANSSPSTITLSGTGTGVATVSATLTPSPLVFSSQAGVTSAAQQATLTNTGQIAIAVGSTPFNGASASDFAVSATTCPSGSATLAVGATCTYSITFTPPSATTYSAGFQVCISTSSYGCIQSVTLQGTGTATPTATLLPTPLAFGNVVQGQTSAPMSATLTNMGTTQLNISSFTITGTNPADFAVSTGTNACGSTLAAGGSCVVYVTFTPAAAAGFSAQLSVVDNAASSSQTVSLTGTGVPASVAPAPLVFNPAPVGVSLGSAQTLTATFQVNGFGAGFTPTAKLHYGLSYSIGAVNCTGTAGSEMCSVPVTFQPQYPGGRREALFLMNGSTRLSSVLIYGIGQGPFAMVQPGVVTNPILSGLNYLYTSTVDENGTVYVLGDNSNSIFAITKAGVVSTLPITGLNSPRGIGIDGAGVLYIADQTYNGPTITWDTVQNVRGTVPFAAPSIYVQSLTVGNTGNLYETDAINVYTVPITGAGTASTKAISPAITQAYIMAVDSNENVFVGGYEINEITSGGVQTQVNTIGAGDGLGVDAADTLYATRYTGTTGVAELPATGYGTFEAALDLGSSPLGTSVGGDGTLYVGNYTNLDKVDRSQGLIAFGEQNQTLGTAGTQQIVTIYNGGNQTLTISNIAITGSPFSIQTATGTNCSSGGTVAPGALCQIAVVVTPLHAGVFNGSITVTSNSLNNASTTQTIALTAFTYGVYVTAAPNPLNFPSQTVNTTSAAQTVTLTNNGDLYSAYINGGFSSTSSAFTVTTGTCGGQIAVGATCQLNVTFTPTLAQPYSSTITFAESSTGGGPNQTVSFTVNGSGLPAAAPAVALSPSPLAFPSTLVGAAGTVLPLTLSNPGTATLGITSISITGTNASSFGQTNNCGTSLAAGSTCTITVTFTPAATGALTAAVSVVDNAAGSPHSASLTGTGIKFVSNVGTSLAAQPVTVNIATAGTLSSVEVLTQGAPNLDFTVAAGGTCATGTAYTVGQTCAVNIVFKPQSPGLRNGELILVNSTGSVLGTTALPGTGIGPQVSFLPSTLTVLGGGFNGPQNLAVNALGDVFVGDTYNSAVKEIPPGCTTASCVTTLVASGFNEPDGIAMDSAGNIYVASPFINSVSEILAVNGTIPATPTVITLSSSFNSPYGVGVDGSGNVYVADTGNNAIKEILAVNGSIPASPTIVTLGSGFAGPSSVVVDKSGNVYVADRGNNAVKEMVAVNGSIPASPTIISLGSGYAQPNGLGLDASGNLYVADEGNNAVKELVAVGGSIPASPAILTLNNSLNRPTGVAVDANGNVYVANFNNQTVVEIGYSNAPAVTFATATAIGTTDTTDGVQKVTVQNIGNAPLTFTGITISTNFKIDAATTTCSTSSPIAASTSCVVGVAFAPTAAGSLAGTLVLTDNNLNVTAATQTISLSGTGVAASAPQAVLSPNPLTFPNTNVGSSAATMPLTLSNPGTAALTITSISITGTNASSFGQTNTCGASLAAGANCTITVTFTPGTTGSLSAAISVADNASGSPHAAALTGAGTQPQATLTSSTLSFPSTLVGTSAGTVSTTLSNPGTAALTITGITVTGTNASSFSQTNNCGTSLAAGSTCLITATFTPASAGNLSATLSITDNATGSPQTAALTGTGIAPQAVLSSNPLAFPATLVSTAAAPLPMTLSNPGTAALTITSISVTGINASSFSQTNNCGATLAAGASCTITVTFTPASAAALTAAISVADSASGSPHTATLTGTGTPPLIPQAVLSPNPLSFPSTTINTPATPLPMTLSNPGNTALTITGITVTGANSSSFGETNNCGASLAAGATCTITVSFTPGSAATLTAAISVADNAAGSPQSATITGVGSAGTYVVNASTPAATIQPGAVAQYNLMVAPLGGSFNNLVTLSATGLPAGATVSFLPPAVTPGSAGAPSVMSIQTTTGLARLTTPQPQRPNSVPLMAILVGIPLVGIAGSLRRLRRSGGRWLLLTLATLAILPILALSGCGGGYFGPAPQTYTVTVTGTSGTLSESTTISLTVQ